MRAQHWARAYGLGPRHVPALHVGCKWHLSVSNQRLANFLTFRIDLKKDPSLRHRHPVSLVRPFNLIKRPTGTNPGPRCGWKPNGSLAAAVAVVQLHLTYIKYRRSYIIIIVLWSLVRLNDSRMLKKKMNNKILTTKFTLNLHFSIGRVGGSMVSTSA